MITPDSLLASKDEAQVPPSPALDVKLTPPTILPGEHPLENQWTFWHVPKSLAHGSYSGTDAWEKKIRPVASFASVEGFWRIYNQLIRPNDLAPSTDVHLFKFGVKPMWEDEANKNGGKLTVRVRKGLASKAWEDLLMATIGETFEIGSEICGIVVSVRYQDDILSVWNRNAENKDSRSKILTRVEQVISTASYEYKPHSLKEKVTKTPKLTEQAAQQPREPREPREYNNNRDYNNNNSNNSNNYNNNRERGERGDRNDRHDRDRPFHSDRRASEPGIRREYSRENASLSSEQNRSTQT